MTIPSYCHCELLLQRVYKKPGVFSKTLPWFRTALLFLVKLSMRVLATIRMTIWAATVEEDRQSKFQTRVLTHSPVVQRPGL